MESGQLRGKEASAAASSLSNVVPFSAARSLSKPSILSRIFKPTPLEESEGPDLEAGPGSEFEDEEETNFGETERKAPKDLV
jgi:hypothetical protein